MSLEEKARLLEARAAVGDDPTALNEFMVDPEKQIMRGTTIHGSMYFEVPYITQIKDNLWQGGYGYGLVLPSHFKHIVSLYPWGRYEVNHELDSALAIRMYDSNDDINVEQLLSIADWVSTCMNSGPTLVHCQAGLNRSSLVVALVIMSRDGTLSGEEAIDIIREKRSPACLCNPTFEKFVKEWEWVEPVLGSK